jgi:hypothetical protein
LAGGRGLGVVHPARLLGVVAGTEHTEEAV